MCFVLWFVSACCVSCILCQATLKYYVSIFLRCFAACAEWLGLVFVRVVVFVALWPCVCSC
ncbi:hypothetical protein BC830DRAFT_1119168 [Chytriomyces sp. MP71]|nr:hypothetical protein BC830DRAFT_1119168 [Chytriomyces sp. MP71]